MRLRLPLLATCLLSALLALVPREGRGQTVWGELAIPGGSASARAAADMATGRDAAWALDFIRQHAPDSPNDWEDAVLRVDRYLAFVRSIQASAAAGPSGVTMSMAGAGRREELNRALRPIGVRIETRRNQHQAALDNVNPSRERWLEHLGIDRAAVVSDLNAGLSATVNIQDTFVPFPLPALWEAEARGRASNLVEVLEDRSAALRYTGLTALDDTTLEFIGERPNLFRWLAGEVAPAFAAFGDALRIRQGIVDTPGGTEAAAAWEQLLGRQRSDPDRFIRALLAHDDGRLAGFYNMVDTFDRDRQQFVLGAHLPAGQRAAFVRRLYERVGDVWSRDWNLAAQPFRRQTFDPAVALSLIEVPDGALALPSWLPSLFERIEATSDWPDDPRSTSRSLRERTPDAEWVVEWLFEEPARAAARFRLLRFAQRQFGSADRAAAADVEIALRSLNDMPALAVSLERMGVRSPAVLSSVARKSRQLTNAGGPRDIGPLLARWQTALALLEQVQRRARLDRAVVEALLTSLAARVPPNRDRARGAVAAWILEDLLPKAAPATAAPPIDRRAVLAFAGVGRHPRRRIAWEGLDYVLDEAGPIAQSAEEIRQARRGPSLDDLRAVHAGILSLRAGPASIDQLQAIVASLQKQDDAFLSLPVTNGKQLPIVEDVRDALAKLGRIRRSQDLGRVAGETDTLLDGLDAITDAAIPALVYALAASPSRQPPEVLADAWAWHRVVPGPGEEELGWKARAWRSPAARVRDGGGRRFDGAFLGLDVVLADALLPAVAVGSSVLNTTADDDEQAALVQTLVLRDPGSDRDGSAVADAMAAGRRLVVGWKDEPGDRRQRHERLRGAGVSARRANLMLWEASRGVDGFDTLTPSEIYRLGTTAPLTAVWGGASVGVDGCLCLMAPGRRSLEAFEGRLGGGMVTAVTDVLLALVEQLHALGVQAAVVEPMLPLAAAHWLDNILQERAEDWDALVQWPRRVSRLAVEEYLLHLVAERLLQPAGEGATP